MSQIEPNLGGLAIFTLAWGVCCLGGLLVAGMFPLSSRPEGAHRPTGLVLIILNTLMIGALLLATIAFGFNELRWTTVVVVAGLVFLFVPGLFQVVPENWRDGPGGLSTMLLLLICTFALVHAGNPAAIFA